MFDTGVLIVGIVVGLPIVCAFATPVIIVAMKHKLKYRELQVQEQKIRMEEKLRTDELNARILRMDDFGMSPTELAALTEQVRQLREEVANLKQESNSRAGGLGV